MKLSTKERLASARVSRAIPPARTGSKLDLVHPSVQTPANFDPLDVIRKQRLALKAELLELMQHKRDLLKARRLWYFRPNPKQMEFIENSLKKRRAGFCGNRFGKSTIGVVEDCCWLIGYRPFFPEGHPLRTAGIPKHGVKGLVIAEDWDKVKEIFTNRDSEDRLGKFFEFLPPDMIKNTTVTAKGIINSIVVTSEIDGQKRESVVMFDTVRSYKQNSASAESSDWDFIHVDEPIEKDFWTAVSRGLIDRGGYAWWLLTPIKEPWMYNEMVDLAKEQPDLYWFFEASMDDNPLLTEQDKKLYLDQLPEDERQARRDGKPLAHARLVFGHFDKDYHVIDTLPADWINFRPPFRTWQVGFAIDTHPQTPHAALFAAMNAEGDVIVYDELAFRGLISDLSDAVKARLQGTRVAYGLCEPGAWKEDQGTGHAYVNIFYAHNIDLIPGSKRKEDAILLLQEWFRQRKRRFLIYKGCVNLIRELKHHHFDDENKPEDKNDHWIECLRRLVIHDDFIYYPPTFTEQPLKYVKDPMLNPGSNFDRLDKDLGLEQLNLLDI